MRTEKEVCELLRKELNKNGLNSKYYIKLDHRLNKYYKENEGKLSSEVYPHHNNYVQNISGHVDSLLYDRESKEYKNYFDFGDEDYKPFIAEVWERTDNIMKLIYKRNNENEDFEEI